MSPSRLTAPLAALLIAFTFSGCASMTVNSYIERGANFDRYLTYAWSPPDDRPTGDPRLDHNTFVFEYLQSEVDGQLIGRGYVRVKGGAPDLTVRAFVKVHEELLQTAGESSVQETGALWIDAIDTRTGTTVWSGWAAGPIDGLVDNQDWLERKIGEVVARIMEKFPAHGYLSTHDP